MATTSTTQTPRQPDCPAQPASPGSALSRCCRALVSPHALLLLLLALLQVACQAATGESALAPPTAPAPVELPSPARSLPATYVETGDLDAINTHGTLRVLTLARPGTACGAAGHGTTELALLDAIRSDQQLAITWACMATEAALARALVDGSGDLVLHGLARTPYTESVALSLPQIVAREWVLTHPENGQVRTVDDLAGLRVAADRHGSGWLLLQEWRKRLPTLAAVTLPEGSTASDIADGLAGNRYDAALVSSSGWVSPPTEADGVHVAFDAGHAPAVHWSVRRDATDLLALIDRHLASVQLASEPAALRHGDLAEIRRQRVLRVLARQQPGSFYLESGDLHGFEYDLLQRFAKRHRVHLEIVVPPADETLVDWLRDGRGDVIGLPQAPSDLVDRAEVSATHPYRNIHTAIVARDGSTEIASPEKLAGLSVAAVRDSLAWSRLHELRASGVDVTVIDVAAATASTALLGALANGRHALVAVTEPLPKVRGVMSLLTLGEPSPWAWATRSDNPELLAALDDFIRSEYRGVSYNVLDRRYASRRGVAADGEADSRLSPYDELVRELADDYGFDWRLIVAQMFQESRFDPQARSTAGARGLMQVMPATGNELGFTDLNRPENSIHAGIMYLAQLRDRFDRDLPVNERLRFALAAYNAGYTRVRAARRLAVEMGLDPDRWFGHVERALFRLPKSKSRIARGHRRCRCGQPVHYVREIQVRYAAYTHLGSEPVHAARVALLDSPGHGVRDGHYLPDPTALRLDRVLM